MKYLILSTSILTISGCVSVADVELQSPTSTISVPSGSEVCFVYPNDGEFEGKAHRNSGNMVGEVILKSIPVTFNIVKSQSEKQCKSNYIVTSEILEYENRASGWSGKPDKIRVKVTAKNHLNGESGVLQYYADTNMAASALFEWGNAAPYKLLDGEFRKQVKALFQE